SIMKAHRRVRQVGRNELSEFESHPVLRAICKLDLGPCHIDLGKLTVNFMEEAKAGRNDVDAFVERELGYLVGVKQKPIDKPLDVILYGFGRIGRLVASLLLEQPGRGEVMRLR